MKRITLSVFFLTLSLSGFCTIWVINNSGFTFSPATITIQLGDSVRFTVASIHKPIEVSESTWNANGNSPIIGFNLPSGGGLLLPAQLGEGTHWYVCQPHAESGMKGRIIVENTTSISNPLSDASISIYPNPSIGKFLIEVGGATLSKNYNLEVFSLQGLKVFAARNLEQQSINEIDLSGLDKGIYFIKLYDGELVYVRKMVVQ